MQETPAQEAWDGFVGGNWQRAVDVRDFIQKNYTPYDGDDSFLAGPTEATTKLWADVDGSLLHKRPQTVVYLIWIPSRFPLSPPTRLAT